MSGGIELWIQYTCKNCGKKFISRSKLKFHTSDVHEKMKTKKHMFHINELKNKISNENKENIAVKPFSIILKDVLSNTQKYNLSLGHYDIFWPKIAENSVHEFAF